jgi:2-oxoglutarate dehydrogenase E2 component (dihydrolipoamide succinyltransferase)
VTVTDVVVVAVPYFGAAVEEAVVLAWLVTEGDVVEADEPVCEVSTDKVEAEVPAPCAGTVRRLLASVGDTLVVGAPLLELAAGATGAVPAGEDTGPTTPRRFDPAGAAAKVVERPRRDGRPLASPRARRLASAAVVDLATITGTGRNGRIRAADVPAAPAVPSGEAPTEVVAVPAGYDDVAHDAIPVSRRRRTIAEHMVRSVTVAPHASTEVDVDMALVMADRDALNQRRAAAGRPPVSVLAWVARATSLVLAGHPALNATWADSHILQWREVNLGLAVDSDEGLVVPVIRRSDRLDVEALGDAIADLAGRARRGRLRPDELRAGTFTITNVGSLGSVTGQPVLHQPQVAILAFGAVVKRPWVVTDAGVDALAVRPVTRLVLGYDHRALDGGEATRALVAIRASLEAWGAGPT